jgi:hypothetical protein
MRQRQPPLFALLFLAVLWLPLLKAVISPAETYALRDHDENAGGGGTEKSWVPAFLRRWDSLANDKFAGRDLLVRGNNLLQVRLLRVSPNDMVMLGRDGWLFLDGPHLEMDYFRGEKPFSEEELAGWRRMLVQRHLWFAGQGIRFVFVIAPNKSTIYPEKVATRIRRNRSRLDQLLDYLERRPLPAGFLLVDLRRTLRAGKPRYPVYRQTDSHWSEYGALLAANKILRALARSFPLPFPQPEDFNVSLGPAAPGGDMAAMLSLADVLRESRPVLVARRLPSRATTVEPKHMLDEQLEKEVSVNPGAPLPEALLFRDSFGYALAAHLADHFQKLTCIRDLGLGFHPRFVREARPRIVIQEMAERFLRILPPENPPELAAIVEER